MSYLPMPPTPPYEVPGDGGASLGRWTDVLVEAPVGGNRVDWYAEADEQRRALTAALAGARDHVNVDAALFGAERVGPAEDIGARLLPLLAARARDGVRLNLLAARDGPLGATRDGHPALARAGARPTPRAPQRRRLMVVDGRVAFVGDSWAGGLLRVEGPAVQRLQRLFVAHWQRVALDALGPARFFPPLPVAGSERVALGNGSAVLLAAIARARLQVMLSTGARAPSRPLVRALVAAASRGVSVDLLLPGSSDGRRARALSRQQYGRLLSAGARLHERAPETGPAETCLIDSEWASVAADGVAARGTGAVGVETDGRPDLVALGDGLAHALAPRLALQIATAQRIDAARWAQRSWWARWSGAEDGRF